MYLGSQFWFILWIYSVIVFLISLTKAKLHVLGHCFPVLIKVFHLYQTYLYLRQIMNQGIRTISFVYWEMIDTVTCIIPCFLYKSQHVTWCIINLMITSILVCFQCCIIQLNLIFLVYCYTHFIWKTLTKSTNLRRILWCIIYCYSD